MAVFACTKADGISHGDKVWRRPDKNWIKKFCSSLLGETAIKYKMANLSAKLIALSKNLMQQAKPKLQVFQAYARVELVPPSLSELPAMKKSILDLINAAKTGRYKEVTVRDAWLNTLVAIEVYCWFFIGECIGKRHLVGYKV